MIVISGWKREARKGTMGLLGRGLGQDDVSVGPPPLSPEMQAILFAKVSPKLTPQVVAVSRLADGPRIVAKIGEKVDPVTGARSGGLSLSFPMTGGKVTVPSPFGGFYKTASFARFIDDLKDPIKTVFTVALSRGQTLVRSRLPKPTVYEPFMAGTNFMPTPWFTEDDGFPVYRLFTIDESGKTKPWVLALKLENPNKTDREAFVFILRPPTKDLLETIWDGLKEIAAFVVEKVGEFIKEVFSPLVCGPAQPFIDEIAVLATIGPVAFGAQRLATLSVNTGVAETELTKVAQNPTAGFVEGITNIVVGKLCPPETPPVLPPPEVPFPSGAVAVFDSQRGEYRILARPF